MNSKEVKSILKRDIHARRVFCGVYATNNLPKLIKIFKPCAFIVNTDLASGPGLHWIAVYFDGRGKGEYFDSFGLPPRHPNIESFIKRHCQNYIYNRRLLQDLTSSMCGAYVVHYVLMKSRGMSMSRILSSFHPHKLRSNDQKVWTLIKKKALIG